jgi:hypothetical protein
MKWTDELNTALDSAVKTQNGLINATPSKTLELMKAFSVEVCDTTKNTSDPLTSKTITTRLAALRKKARDAERHTRATIHATSSIKKDTMERQAAITKEDLIEFLSAHKSTIEKIVVENARGNGQHYSDRNAPDRSEAEDFSIDNVIAVLRDRPVLEPVKLTAILEWSECGIVWDELSDAMKEGVRAYGGIIEPTKFPLNPFTLAIQFIEGVKLRQCAC